MEIKTMVIFTLVKITEEMVEEAKAAIISLDTVNTIYIQDGWYNYHQQE